MENEVELRTGPEICRQAVFVSLLPAGFLSSELAFGYAVLVSSDLAAWEQFDAGLLAFTERLATKVGPINGRGPFLHCKRRLIRPSCSIWPGSWAATAFCLSPAMSASKSAITEPFQPAAQRGTS